MLGLIQKILLTIVSIVIALTMAFGFYLVVFAANTKFRYEMLIFVGLVVFGILSFVFHLKTLKFYRTKALQYLNYEKEKPFWIFNIAFIFNLLVLSSFILHRYYELSQRETSHETELWPFILVTFITFGICTWLFLDARYLYRNHKILEAKAAFNTIDDIKGVDEKEDE
jgi:hypothetical protein